MTKAGWAVLIVGGLIVIGAMNGNGDSDGGSNSADSYGAKDACHSWVKDDLKSPSSADFSNDDVSGSGSGPWTITGDVDSENSFGAKLRSSWTCQVRLDGDYYKGHAQVLG